MYCWAVAMCSLFFFSPVAAVASPRTCCNSATKTCSYNAQISCESAAGCSFKRKVPYLVGRRENGEG